MAMSLVIRKTCRQTNVPLVLSRAISTSPRSSNSINHQICGVPNNQKCYSFSTSTDNVKGANKVGNQYSDYMRLLSFSTLRDVFKIVDYYLGRYDADIGDFVNWDRESDRLLKPAVYMPKPPVDFPFEICEAPPEEGEEDPGILLGRELPHLNICITARCRVEFHPSTTPDSFSFFRNFLPADQSDFKDFDKILFAFEVSEIGDPDPDLPPPDVPPPDPHIPGMPPPKTKSDDPGHFHRVPLVFSGKRLKFAPVMDSEQRKYWGKVFHTIGLDDEVIRYLIVYFARRNKLKAQRRLPNMFFMTAAKK